MATNFPYIITDRSVTAFVNNKSYSANSTHPNFQLIADQLKSGVKNVTEFVTLFDIIQSITVRSGGKIEVKGNQVLYAGSPIHSTLTDRLLKLLSEGFDVTPLIQFAENLYQNPSNRCVNSVYDFLAANNVPITPDGHALMFKKVRGDYYDIHSGTVPNKLAQNLSLSEQASLRGTYGKGVNVDIEDGVTVISVARNQVDENIDQTCSYGLHVCSESYLPHFGSRSGDRVVVCKVNPRDIVANPRDYKNAKLRVSRYAIVSEIEEEKAKTYFNQTVMTGTEGTVYADIEDTWDTTSRLNYSDDYDDYAECGADWAVDSPEVGAVPEEVRVVSIAGVDAKFTLNDAEDDEWYVTWTIDGTEFDDFQYGDNFEEVLEDFKSEHIETVQKYLVHVRGFSNQNDDVINRTIEFESTPYFDNEVLTKYDFVDDPYMWEDDLNKQAPEIDSNTVRVIDSVLVSITERWV